MFSRDKKPASGRVELSELVEQVATELRVVQAKSRTDPAVMQFSEAEVELSAIVEKDARAGIKVYVAELGGGVKKSDGTRVTLKFSSMEATTIALLKTSVGLAAGDAAQASAGSPAPPVQKQQGH